ncbi:hypothetical protein SEEP3036_09631 [Salmonella enterica subsp. enterica serovar Pullorum str. 13036]|nr:hypothetical protein SEEP3036_09631 [Salmonella enterica subsp. enterica serovar Pullorum str. 13036]
MLAPSLKVTVGRVDILLFAKVIKRHTFTVDRG